MRRRIAAVAAIAVAVSACAAPSSGPPPTPPPSGRTDREVRDTVRVVAVRIHTTHGGASGVFAPSAVRVRRGDLVRFWMADGGAAHNVSFTAFLDPPAGLPLPADSPYLTEKGQSWEFRVDLPPGSYSFGCTPHFAMRQRGTLIVEDDAP